MSDGSEGAVGSPYDNAMVEAVWGRMQVELLNRRRWKTRVELATAISDSIDRFHNSRRRHTPSACSPPPNTNTTTPPRTPPDSRNLTPPKCAQIEVSFKTRRLQLQSGFLLRPITVVGGSRSSRPVPLAEPV